MDIINFFNHPFFIFVGGITSALAVISITGVLISWIFGISPILWKLGLSRWRRNIGILADQDNYVEIKSDLVNSGLFRDPKIDHITEMNISSVSNYSLSIVHYESFSEEHILEILSNKKHGSGMIFYFPEYERENGNKIPDRMMNQIRRRSNTILVTFRGRLLNDVLITFVTSSLGKHD